MRTIAFRSLEAIIYLSLIVVGFLIIIPAAAVFVFAPHELGHLLAGLAVGFDVQTFSIGYGGEMWGMKLPEALLGFDALGIHWQLAPLPLGAFVEVTACCVEGELIGFMGASGAGIASSAAILFTLYAGPLVNIIIGVAILRSIVRNLRIKMGVKGDNWVAVKTIVKNASGKEYESTATFKPTTWFAIKGELIAGLRGLLDLGYTPSYDAYTAAMKYHKLKNWKFYLGGFTLVIGVINLLPVPPLDGGLIIWEWLYWFGFHGEAFNNFMEEALNVGTYLVLGGFLGLPIAIRLCKILFTGKGGI